MKRVVCLLTALVLCIALAVPAFAATVDFVPSITYKPGIEVDSAEMNGEDVSSSVIVTSIKDAKDKTTDIEQSDRDLLLELYEKLSNGEMKLPLEGDYVIREMIDLSLDDAHSDKMGQDGATLTVTFDMNIKDSTNLKVLSYVNGEWKPVKSVKINGDGTVTVEFEALGPVVFCVENEAGKVPPQTGDEIGRNLILWVVLMVASAAVIVVLVANRRKIAR